MKTTNETLDIFFKRTIEKNYNEEMLNRNYNFPLNTIENYIDNLCGIEIDEYVNYIYNLQDIDSVLPKNIFQFSSFEDCTEKLCKQLIACGDEGYKFDEIGKMLLNDGNERKVGAYRKYGENAVKTGSELGLIQIIENYSFLSCLGYVYPTIEREEKYKFTSLLILRSTFFLNLVKESKDQCFDIHLLLMSLSQTTQKRRISNLKYLIQYLRENNSPQLNKTLDNIKVN